MGKLHIPFFLSGTGVHVGEPVFDALLTEGGREESRWTEGGGGERWEFKGFPLIDTHSDTHLSSFSSRLAPLCWNECLRIKKQGGWTRGPQDWDWRARAGLDYCWRNQIGLQKTGCFLLGLVTQLDLWTLWKNLGWEWKLVFSCTGSTGTTETGGEATQQQTDAFSGMNLRIMTQMCRCSSAS